MLWCIISREGAGAGSVGGVFIFRALSILTNTVYVSLLYSSAHLISVARPSSSVSSTISLSNNLSVPSFSSSMSFSCYNLASAANALFTFVKVHVVDAVCPARICFFFTRSSAFSVSVSPCTTTLYLSSIGKLACIQLEGPCKRLQAITLNLLCSLWLVSELLYPLLKSNSTNFIQHMD